MQFHCQRISTTQSSLWLYLERNDPDRLVRALLCYLLFPNSFVYSYAAHYRNGDYIPVACNVSHLMKS